MFSNLLDFERARSRGEAIGFYLASFGLLWGIIFVCVLTGFVVTRERSISAYLGIGMSITVAYSMALSSAVLKAKGLLRHPGFILIALLGVLGAATVGGLLAMVAPAFLSSRQPRRMQQLGLPGEVQSAG